MATALTGELMRTLDDGALTASRIDSHIIMAESLLRGLVVLSGSSDPPQVIDVMIHATQSVFNILMFIGSIIKGRQCRGDIGCIPWLIHKNHD